MPSHPKIDCHVHVFDPARFPYAADAWYQPSGGETGTAANLGQVLDAHGVQHALIVGPNSGYGLDNRCLLDALAQGAGRYKGVAVVRDDASRAELQDLQAAGVVGVAFNVALLGVDFYQGAGPLLERLRELGLWAQVQVQADELVALKPMLQVTTAAAPTRPQAWARPGLPRCWRWRALAAPASSSRGSPNARPGPTPTRTPGLMCRRWWMPIRRRPWSGRLTGLFCARPRVSTTAPC